MVVVNDALDPGQPLMLTTRSQLNTKLDVFGSSRAAEFHISITDKAIANEGLAN